MHSLVALLAPPTIVGLGRLAVDTNALSVVATVSHTIITAPIKIKPRLSRALMLRPMNLLILVK